MKRGKVTCRLDPTSGWAGKPSKYVATGYRCEIGGIEFVVHRSVVPDEAKRPTTSDEFWTVSEPITGRSIWDGSKAGWLDHQTRALAISEATRVIDEQGGSAAVKREIAKHGPDADRSEES